MPINIFLIVNKKTQKVFHVQKKTFNFAPIRFTFLNIDIMYTINFTGTGSATLDNFTETEQKQVLYVLDNVVSNYDEKAPDKSKIRYLGDGFHVIRVNHNIRVAVKIQNNIFKIIDVFRHTRSESLVSI